MKISVITATFNSASHVGQALASVQSQTGANVEHVLVDGASNDGTLQLLEAAKRPSDRLVSEPDNGIYDALNKGIRQSTGDIVGFLHSDDTFANTTTLQQVAQRFVADDQPELVFGALRYINRQTGRTVRTWKPRLPTRFDLGLGWMPPHPTVFVHRNVYERFGLFDTDFRISGDYDWLLRVFSKGIRAACLDSFVTLMATGGASNRSAAAIQRKMFEDIRAIQSNSVGFWPITLTAKNLRKIGQLLVK